MTRYLSGLCVAGLGLCGGGWLLVAAVAFGGMDGGDARRVNLATGAGLIVVSCVTAVAWVMAWRRRMRADGVLGERFDTVSRRQARRNRRELTRDVRRAARSAKQAAREARRLASRVPRLADGGLADGGLAGLGLGGSGLGGGGLTGGGLLADSGFPGSGLSGGGLGEPRGWIGGGRTGYAPHGPARAGQGQAGPGTMEVLVELRTLRALLTPLLEAAARESAAPPEGEPAPPPLPRRQPGQERPGIPRQRADQPDQGAYQPDQYAYPPGQQPDQPEQVGQPERADQDELAVSEAAGQADGLIAGEGELLRLADNEEAWW